MSSYETTTLNIYTYFVTFITFSKKQYPVPCVFSYLSKILKPHTLLNQSIKHNKLNLHLAPETYHLTISTFHLKRFYSPSSTNYIL